MRIAQIERIKAVDIVSKEAPEVAREIVILGALKAAAVPLSWLIVFIVLVYYRKPAFLSLDGYREECNDGFCGVAKTVYTLVQIVILSLSAYSMFQVAYIVFAPRVYLLEYVSKLFGH